MAPVLVPWMFGPHWDAAVTPTQILVVGGASTLMIDACGSALMAVGRASTLLGFGVAHFVFYVGAVLALVHLGLNAVAIGGAVVHTVFLGVAYLALLRGEVKSPTEGALARRRPGAGVCAGLVALAVPANLALGAVSAPAFLHILATSAAAGVGYLVVLRLAFPACARDLARRPPPAAPDRAATLLRRPRFGGARGPAPDRAR